MCRFLAGQSLKIEDRLKRWLASPFLLPAFALYTAATLWPYHGGQVHEGFIFFRPHLPSLVYYGSFFVFGYLFHAHRSFLQALARNVSAWAVLAAILFPLAMVASQLDNDAAGFQHRAPPGRRDRKRSVHLGADLLFPRPRAALLRPRIAVDPVRIAVVVLGLPHAYAARLPGRDGGWCSSICRRPLKFLLVCAFTAALAFLSFHYWVQKTWLGVFLHGRRLDLDWPWREPALARSRQA